MMFFFKNFVHIWPDIEKSKAAIYLLLTGVFLLTFGPFNSTLIAFYLRWNIITLTICILVIVAFLFHFRKSLQYQEANLWILLCLLYAGMVSINSLFHGVALSVPDTLKVNVAGLQAMDWGRENTKFTIFYLFFPILCLLQYILLKRMDTNVFIRFFAFTTIISLVILFYQHYIDITLFNMPYWIRIQRIGGLSTDPNSYAMTAFLLLPLFISGVFFETRKILKALYIILIIFLLIGMIFSGNRTGAGGILLLSIFSPMILAMAFKQWPGQLRLILFFCPFVFMIGTYLALPFIMDQIQSIDMEVLTKRLVLTWQTFEKEGLNPVFEERGKFFLIAWALLLKAPLGGWGPGGYYREYPNELYIQSDNIRHSLDSALNHYLMISGDMGLPVLFLNLILIILPLVIAVYILRKLSDIKQRFFVAILLVANVIFLLMMNTIPPSYFPDLIWVWTAQLAYLVVVGKRNGILFKVTSKNWLKIFSLTIVAFILVAFGSYQTSFGSKGYYARQQADWWPFKYEQNCYGIERWGKKKVCWCSKSAFLKIPIAKALPTQIKLAFKVHHPDLQSKPVTVKYGGKKGVIHEMILKDHSWKMVEIQVTSDYIFVSPDKPEKKYFVLSLDVSRTWVPKKWGVNEDTRELGVAVSIPGP